MKILLWPTHYLPYIGGLEVMVHSLALQLKKQGHEVLVIANAEEYAEFFIEEIKVYTFPFIKALGVYNLILIKKTLDKIHEIFDSFLPDIVNVHGWFECFCFYQTRILSKKKIPLCITIHGLLEQKYYQTEACVKLWSMAGGINTVSNALIHSLKQQQCSHSSIRVIYNGLSPSSHPIAPLQCHPSQLLMVGRLTEEKCFDVAFHALKILIKNRSDIKLRLVGGGFLYQDLLRLKEELGLDPWIEMTDYVPPYKVRQYIDEASLILVPSYYESFCLVALEAALRSRPVVASSVYGLKEVIEHEKTGLLIEPKNPLLLAETIEKLLSSPQKMVEMGDAARQRALELFSIETTAKNYLEMYRSLL